jgi:hypothetical protein
MRDLLRIDQSCASQSELVFGALGDNAIRCADAGLRVFAAAAERRKTVAPPPSNDAFP